MTVQYLKVTVQRRPIIKARAVVSFPAILEEGPGISIDREGNGVEIGLDYSKLAEITTFDASQKLFAIYDRATGVWNKVSFASLIAAGQTQQIVDTGNVVVKPNDGLIAINKTVGAATSVMLPLSADKVGPVKIADFKGDAGTNNITINVQGTDKFSGNLTSWVIGSDTGSVVLHPIQGGYVV